METKPAQVRNLEAEKAEREAQKREEWAREIKWVNNDFKKIEEKWWSVW